MISTLVKNLKVKRRESNKAGHILAWLSYWGQCAGRCCPVTRSN